jgi:hypothetical protein
MRQGPTGCWLVMPPMLHRHVSRDPNALLLRRFGRVKPRQLQELRRAGDDELGLGVRRRSAKLSLQPARP